MTGWIIFIVGLIAVAGTLAFYFFVLIDIIAFHKRCGFTQGEFSGMNVLSKGVSEKLVQSFFGSEHAYKCIEQERVYGTNVISQSVYRKILANTTIALCHDKNSGYKGLAFREWHWLKFRRRYIIMINYGSEKVRGFSEHTVAKLILHEIIHHYIWKESGEGDWSHNSPLWKELGV